MKKGQEATEKKKSNVEGSHEKALSTRIQDKLNQRAPKGDRHTIRDHLMGMGEQKFRSIHHLGGVLC